MRRISIFLNIFCICFQLAAVNKLDLQVLVNSYAARYNVPDLSMAVLKGKDLFFVSNKVDSAGLKIYPIVDMTSSFTAFLVLKLAEQGVIQLDRPVDYYLPWFAIKDKHASKLITVRNLLNQTSGFIRKQGFENFSASNLESIQNYLAAVELSDEPGTEFHYSALNYQILGLIVSTMSSKPYSALLQDYLVAPLHLEHTSVLSTTINTNGYQYAFAFPFRSNKSLVSPWNVPVIGVQSSTRDLLAYCQLMMNEAVVDQDTLLKPEKFELLVRPKYSRYAMGWYSGNRSNHNTYSHWGLSAGYSSKMTFLPDEQLAVVILSNINSITMVDNLNNSVLDYLLLGKQEVIFPYELLLRVAYLFWTMWSLYELYVYFKLWRWFGYPFHFNFRFLSYYRLFVGIIIPLSWLYIIPRLTTFPLSNIFYAQPDMALCLFISVLAGILLTMLRILIKNRHRDKKKIAEKHEKLAE